MSDDLQTVSPDQVPALAAVPAEAFVFVQSEGGPIQKIPYGLLLAKLIAAGLVKTDEDTLQADLAHDADVVALVENDPDPLRCGWYRKTGASGAGNWVLFEQLAKAVRDSAQAWAEGTLPGGVGTKSSKEYSEDTAALLATAEDFQFDAPALAAVLAAAAAQGRVTLDQAVSLYRSGLFWDFIGDHYVLAGVNASDPNHFAALTATRASTAYALTNEGKYQSFANDVMRVTDRGALLEAAGTNIITTPTVFTSGWTVNLIGFGTATGEAPTVTPANATNLVEIFTTSGSHVLTRAWTPAGTGVHTEYVVIKRGVQRYAILSVIGAGIATEMGVVVDFDAAGAPTVATCSGLAPVTTANMSITPLYDGWQLVTLTFTTTAAGDITVKLYPSDDPAYANRQYSGVVGQTALKLWHWQLEAGAVATSPTTGTRAADNVAVALAAGSTSDSVTVISGAGTTQFARSTWANPLSLNLVTDGGGAWLGKYITSALMLPALPDGSRSPAQQVQDLRDEVNAQQLRPISAALRRLSRLSSALTPIIGVTRDQDLVPTTPNDYPPFFYADDASATYYYGGKKYQTRALMLAAASGVVASGVTTFGPYVASNADNLIGDAVWTSTGNGFTAAANGSISVSAGELFMDATGTPATFSRTLRQVDGRQMLARGLMFDIDLRRVGTNFVFPVFSLHSPTFNSGNVGAGNNTTTYANCFTYGSLSTGDCYIGATAVGGADIYAKNPRLRFCDPMPNWPAGPRTFRIKRVAPNPLPASTEVLFEGSTNMLGTDGRAADYERLELRSTGDIVLLRRFNTGSGGSYSITLGTVTAGQTFSVAWSVSHARLAGSVNGGTGARHDNAPGMVGYTALRINDGMGTSQAFTGTGDSFAMWQGFEELEALRSMSTLKTGELRTPPLLAGPRARAVQIIGDSHSELSATGFAGYFADLGYEILPYGVGGTTDQQQADGWTARPELYGNPWIDLDGSGNGHPVTGSTDAEFNNLATRVTTCGHNYWMVIRSDTIGPIVPVITTAKASHTAGGGDFAATPTLAGGFVYGTYWVTFITATRYRVEDPNGKLVSYGTTGVAFAIGGLAFTINTSGAAYQQGDQFTIGIAKPQIAQDFDDLETRIRRAYGDVHYCNPYWAIVDALAITDPANGGYAASQLAISRGEFPPEVMQDPFHLTPAARLVEAKYAAQCWERVLEL